MSWALLNLLRYSRLRRLSCVRTTVRAVQLVYEMVEQAIVPSVLRCKNANAASQHQLNVFFFDASLTNFVLLAAVYSRQQFLSYFAHHVPHYQPITRPRTADSMASINEPGHICK